MTRVQLNLALAAVVAALAAAVFFSQKKEEHGPPLTAIASGALTKISIEHPNADAIHLEKQNGAWKLTAPVAIDADSLEVNAFIALAGQETQKTLDPASVKLSDLGLDPPQYSIKLNDTVVAFGGVEPLEFHRYVKTGDAVYLIPDPPGAALDADYADLVGKSLLPEGTDIVRIDLPGLTLQKNAEGQWNTNPADAKATAEALQKLVDGWKNARAMWNELAKDKGKPARGETVTLTLKDRQVQFVIAEREPQFKLLRPDLNVRYVLSKALADELLKLPEAQKEQKPAAPETK